MRSLLSCGAVRQECRAVDRVQQCPKRGTKSLAVRSSTDPNEPGAETW